MTKEEKARYEAMSYEEFLRIWRFAKVGDPRFQGKDGEFMANLFSKKRKACPDPAQASKNVGW